ncbi:MAG: 5'-nucleotidase [Burkholderiaceae bacterium]|jgi:5'-nucleotidase|nr:5'-nucleotidase [Burkholderiaceae bacterium]
MAYPIENKLVIGIASSALFDLAESDAVFREKGVEAYRQYQEKHIDQPLRPGVAFPFIRRFLEINKRFTEQSPVEVVLLSRNSPETGLRVFRSIQQHELDITRAAFNAGNSPHLYLPAFNASLFLSANEEDVQRAIDAHYPAGTVLPTKIFDDEKDGELRVAFDFDGVIADDEAEAVFQQDRNLAAFHAHEASKQAIALRPGPLADFFRRLAALQQLEEARKANDPEYKKLVRIAIITARSAPAHERVVTTLKSWGVSVDEAFFLGGMEKARILNALKPHIFFDDQRGHLKPGADNVSMVHVPFGVTNKARH